MSLRRLLAVFQLDFAFQIRRPLFWFLIILSLLLAFGLSIGDVSIRTGDRSVGGKRAFMTSEFAVTQALVLEVFLLYVFFITIAAGMSLIRDGELKIMDLLGSSSLRASEYTWGKYAASAGMTLAALTATVFFSALFNHNMPRSDAEEVRGAFVLSHYLRPVVFMILPFLVFLTGTAFAIGGLLRRPIVIFCLPVAILAFCAFFLWQYSPTWLDPRINDALGLVDPSGFRWLNETFLKNDRGTEYYNYQPVAYSGAFIASRLVYVAVGLASVAFCAYRFRRSLRATPGTTPAPAKPAMPSTDRSQAVARPDRTPVPAVSRPGFFASAWRVAAVECAALLRQPGMYLFIPLILIQTLAHATFTQGAFETELILTSGGMAARSANFLTFLGCLLLLFYTVESFERDRYCGFAPLLHSSPVATGSVLMGKAWANSLVAVIMLACAWIASIVILAIQNQAPIEVAPFALLWGAILLPTFVLWTSFVTAVDALTRNRFASYAIALAALAGTGWLSIRGDMCWAWNWPLWGALVWSDIGNFEVDRKVLILNRVAAILAAAFFIYIATRRAPRADRDAVRTMQRLSGRPFWIGSLKTVCAALPAVVVVLWTWGEVRAGSQGTLTLRKIEDYWKKNVATWVNEPQPDLARVDLTLELDPPARAFHSVGSFELINSKTTPLQRFALTAGPHWNLVAWKLNGEPCKTENRAGLHVFELAHPLAKGDTVRVGFDIRGHLPIGCSKNGEGPGYFVLPSGVVLSNFGTDFVPFVGYERSAGPQESAHRPEPREYSRDFWEGHTDAAFGSNVPFHCRVTITGPELYMYNCVGTLRSDSVEGGQRTCLWETEHPVMAFNVVAGEWKVRRGEGVALFYNKKHAYNIDEMFHALAAARKWYSEWFRPYPWKELKLSEFPGLRGYAQGFPTNITFSESIGFMAKSDSKVRLAEMVVAHESAHQWWGNIMQPGEGRNGNLLSEGMAHFSTILLLEKLHGDQARIEFCKRIEERYGRDRRPDAEKPLIDMDGNKDGDTTLWYDKGGWAFWMLDLAMGREAHLQGLRSLIRKFENGPDHPVLQDMLLELRPFAPDAAAFDRTVDQWFKSVVIPQFEFSDVAVAPIDSTWRSVTGKLTNAGTGAFDVEIAATTGIRFPESAEGEKSSTAATAKQYREARASITLGPGESKKFEIRCDFEPEQVLADPDAKILQLRRNRAIHRF